MKRDEFIALARKNFRADDEITFLVEDPNGAEAAGEACGRLKS